MKKSRLLGFLLCAIAGAFGVYSIARNAQQFGGIAGHTIPAKERPSPLVRSLRPNYPYSIIPGGAYSLPELTYAHSKDPVVQAHYADFRVKDAKLVQLTDDRFQYASYRIKNQVYWTKKKLRIPKGELIWSDGVSYARARCGNRLSSNAKLPVGPTEPPEALLSMPPISPDMLPKLALIEPPPLGDIAQIDKVPTTLTHADAPPNVIPAPVGSVWGPGPISFPGTPIVSGPVGAPPISTLPTTQTPTSTPPPTSTPIPVPPVQPPPNVSPVPEPGTALYLFFLTLFGSLWAIWRWAPKEEDEPDQSPD